MIENNLKEELIAVAEKQLPAVQVELFKRHIEESEKVNSLNIELLKTVDIQKDRIKCLEKNAKDEAELNSLRESLYAKSATLANDRIEFDKQIAVAEVRNACEVEKQELTVSLFETVFKPATLRKEVQREVGRAMSGGQYLADDYNTNQKIPLDAGDTVSMDKESETEKTSEE